MESKIKHLEFVQGAVDRMAKNSFLLKGWSITVMGGLFALGFDEINCLYLKVSVVILSFFWALDGYYLRQEKLFRELYNHVRLKKDSEVDFSMNTKPFEDKVSLGECIFSSTTVIFYGGLVLAHLIISFSY